MLALKKLPQMLYAGVRGVGPYMETAGPSFDKLMAWAGPMGLIGPQTSVLGLSWDNPAEVPPERLRYDAAITIEKRIDIPAGFHIGALPALTWATLTHRGSYAKITETFGQLMAELGKRTDLIAVGLCGLENYLNPPNTPEADMRTDVAFPVVQI